MAPLELLIPPAGSDISASDPRVAENVGKIDHILTNIAGVARFAIARLADDRRLARKPFENGGPATILNLESVRQELDRVRDDVIRLLNSIGEASEGDRQVIIDVARDALLFAFHTIKKLEDDDVSGDYKRGFSIALDVALDRIDDLKTLGEA
jgi:hypothetical protein